MNPTNESSTFFNTPGHNNTASSLAGLLAPSSVRAQADLQWLGNAIERAWMSGTFSPVLSVSR